MLAADCDDAAAGRLHRIVREALEREGIAASIGMASARSSREFADAMLDADKAMYADKLARRDAAGRHEREANTECPRPGVRASPLPQGRSAPHSTSARSILATVSSLPSRATTSFIAGDAVVPVTASRSGWPSFPKPMPSAATLSSSAPCTFAAVQSASVASRREALSSTSADAGTNCLAAAFSSNVSGATVEVHGGVGHLVQGLRPLPQQLGDRRQGRTAAGVDVERREVRGECRGQRVRRHRLQVALVHPVELGAIEHRPPSG